MEEGGIQALLRLARARSTDEELQYKAALTVGHLASNAVDCYHRLAQLAQVVVPVLEAEEKNW